MTADPLWAPWRLPFILGEAKPPDPEETFEFLSGAEPECFLCQAAVTKDHRAHHVVLRTEHTVTVLNRYPYNSGHVLLAPRRHVARLEELPEAVGGELMRNLARLVGLLETVMRPEGFNVGLNLGRVAGAGLPGHLHWHIVPRWNGDTNFMPVLGDTNVIPQALDALWEQLTEAIGPNA
ncbi:MAG: HIT domain-containing protein [Pirellulales bacterium]|nr:HIT domain-containing protein [Pirellulales bacterium]